MLSQLGARATSNPGPNPDPGDGGGYLIRGGQVFYSSELLESSKTSLSFILNALPPHIRSLQSAETSLDLLRFQALSEPMLRSSIAPAATDLSWGVVATSKAIEEISADLELSRSQYEAAEESNRCSMQFLCGDMQGINLDEQGYRAAGAMLALMYGDRVWLGVRDLAHGSKEGQLRLHHEKFRMEPKIATMKQDTAGVPGTLVTRPVAAAGQAMLRTANASNKSTMAVEVSKYSTPQGDLYVAVAGGTQDPGFSGTSANPQDGINMAVELQGEKSIAGEAMEAAIRQAVPENARVIMVGHSQGGTVMDNLAHDPKFAADYNVELVATFGAPLIEHKGGAAVKTVAVRGADDPIPSVAEVVPATADRLEVTTPPLPGRKAFEFDWKDLAGTGAVFIDPHLAENYAKRAELIQDSTSPDLEAAKRPFETSLGGATLVSSTMLSVSKVPLTRGEVAAMSRLEGQGKAYQEHVVAKREKAERARERDDFLKRGK